MSHGVYLVAPTKVSDHTAPSAEPELLKRQCPSAMVQLTLGTRGTSAKIFNKEGFDDFPEHAGSTYAL